MDMKKI